MAVEGHLIERGSPGETCGLKGFEVGGRRGGRICGSREPGSQERVPQLPRPAIIRLSGATISVNVLDSELGTQAEAN